MTVKPLIILDRDGVINEDRDDFIKSEREWVPIPGSLEAIGLLTKLGFPVAIATNQSGIGRGLFTEAALARIHQTMRQAIQNVGGQIAYLAYCPHIPDDHCHCRKPKPGLLFEISTTLQLPLSSAVVIGDSYRDLEAAFTVGAQAILVLTGKGKKTLFEHPELRNKVPIYSDLAAAVRVVAQNFA